MNWFYLEKPNSSVRIVRVSNPDNYKSFRGLSCLSVYPVRPDSLLQRINADGDLDRNYVDLVSTNGDAHPPLNRGGATD